MYTVGQWATSGPLKIQNFPQQLLSDKKKLMQFQRCNSLPVLRDRKV